MKGLVNLLTGGWFAERRRKRKARVLQFGKLTWVGLMIVALGWTLLLSGVSLADLLIRTTGHASPSALAINMATLAQCTILSGFGLAILGLLQTGFGALNRFFDSVLERTSKRPEADPATGRIEPEMRSGAMMPGRRPPPAKVRTNIVERGLIKDRAYKRFGDGTIEVETLLGLRRFPSMRDAAEFIG